jgi:hypothetical protein
VADKIEERIRGLLADEGLTLEGLGADAKKGPGRPRTRPADEVKLTVSLARAGELDAVNAAADRAGLSTAAWLRQVVLAAARRK